MMMVIVIIIEAILLLEQIHLILTRTLWNRHYYPLLKMKRESIFELQRR